MINEALSKAMSIITKAHPTISYIIDQGLVVLNLQLTTKAIAGGCARNWWLSIKEQLDSEFYYEVGVTWKDENGSYLEKRTSHHFPHKASSNPHQITFPTKPKAKLRLTSVGDISKIG